MKNWREPEENPFLFDLKRHQHWGVGYKAHLTSSATGPRHRPSDSGDTNMSFHEKALPSHPQDLYFQANKNSFSLSVLLLSPRMVVVMVICSAKLWKHTICFVLEFIGERCSPQHPQPMHEEVSVFHSALPRQRQKCPLLSPTMRVKSTCVFSTCKLLSAHIKSNADFCGGCLEAFFFNYNSKYKDIVRRIPSFMG